MTINELITAINAGGVLLLLVGALFGGSRGWWVYGATFLAMQQDRDEWKDLALRGLQAADKATTVAAAHVKPPEAS